MDALQSFVFDNTRHKVCIIRGENGDPLFKASDVGKVLSIQNIHPSMASFDEREKVLSTVATPGGKQETTFLTEQGVLKIVMRSRKPIAVPFQNWVFDVIKTISRTGRYELEKEIATIKDKYDQHLRDSEKLFREYKDADDERTHKVLIEGFEDKCVVYFGKIRTMDDGRQLIKIGCTKNIRQRAWSLRQEFGSMAIFKIIECDNHEPFERFLLEHIDIRRYAYKDLVNGLKRSHEVFCMTINEVERAVNIATRNVSQFRVSKKRDFDDLVNTNPTVRALCEKTGISINEDVDSTDVEYRNKRGRCTLTGPKIQAYSTDGSSLVKTYDTLVDASRDLDLGSGSRDGINVACEKRTVRYGHRWAQLDRSQPDDTVQDIGETVYDVPIRTGIVAGMNEDKSEILKVYSSFKACGVENGFSSAGAVQKRVKRGALVGGHQIVPWAEIPEDIQDKWLENNTLPEVVSNATCKKINRLDPVTGTVLRTYATMNEVVMKFKLTPRTLKSAIKGDLVKYGFKWQYA